MKAQLLLLVLAVSFQITASYYFNNYVYAQQWPTAFCVSKGVKSSATKPVNSTDQLKEYCSFAANITRWTVHGLWPSVNESYPLFCNSTWKLHIDDFSNLQDTMKARWPSFAVPRDDFGFWDHEWTKHGTCATQVPALRGPENYFSKGLQLNAQYDLLSLLRVKNVVPRDDPYKYYDLQDALMSLFNEKAILGCIWDHQHDRQLLAQIEICFDKQFKLTCDPELKNSGALNSYVTGKDIPEVETCSDKMPIYYGPIPH